MHEKYVQQVKAVTDTWEDGTEIRFRLQHTGEMAREQYKKDLQKYVCGGDRSCCSYAGLQPASDHAGSLL